MTHLSRPAQKVAHSGIREIVHMVAARPEADIVRLEIGEPSFPTPDHIVEAGAAAAMATGYTPSAGIWELRDAIAQRMRRVHDLTVPVDQIIVSQGAVQACAVTFAALLEPGDEVLVPDPAWPNYAMLVQMMGATPIGYPLRANAGFVPDPDEIAGLITARTKILVINSPSNPTGTVVDEAVIAALAELGIAKNLVIVSDEVYDELIFSGAPANLFAKAPDHTVGVYSFSKTYAMTGWRVGYAAAPDWLAPTLVKLQEPMLSCISSMSQVGALAALQGPQDAVGQMRQGYAARAETATKLLADAGLTTTAPQGAFYLMLPLANGVDSRSAAFDLVEAGVSVAPGTAFGTVATDHIRLSLATDEPLLVEGIGRILSWYERTDGGATIAAAPAMPGTTVG